MKKFLIFFLFVRKLGRKIGNAPVVYSEQTNIPVKRGSKRENRERITSNGYNH